MEVVKREALAALLSAAREMLRQVVVPAATGKVENLAGLEAAYVELSGAVERWDEAMEVSPFRAVLEAFTCRCALPVSGELGVCRACGSFVPDSPIRQAA